MVDNKCIHCKCLIHGDDFAVVMPCNDDEALKLGAAGYEVRVTAEFIECFKAKGIDYGAQFGASPFVFKVACCKSCHADWMIKSKAKYPDQDHEQIFKMQLRQRIIDSVSSQGPTCCSCSAFVPDEGAAYYLMACNALEAVGLRRMGYMIKTHDQVNAEFDDHYTKQFLKASRADGDEFFFAVALCPSCYDKGLKAHANILKQEGDSTTDPEDSLKGFIQHQLLEQAIKVAAEVN